MGRTKDIAAESIAAGVIRVIGPMKAKLGWSQAGGKFHLEGSNAAVKFAIIRLTK